MGRPLARGGSESCVLVGALRKNEKELLIHIGHHLSHGSIKYLLNAGPDVFVD